MVTLASVPVSDVTGSLWVAVRVCSAELWVLLVDRFVLQPVCGLC